MSLEPIVLTSNEATVSGHDYDDRTGESYEFPDNYLRLVQPGRCFVYYRGRARAGGGTQPQVYLGVGVVGAVHAAASGLSRCDILDYRPFAEPLSFKRADGTYYEAAPPRAGYYWLRGVREISQESYMDILLSGEARGVTDGSVAVDQSPAGTARPARGRDVELMRQVEEFAVAVASRVLAGRFPAAAVVEQPRNNPGFDLLVGDGVHFCEVKGTRQPAPVFFLSEGERAFGSLHAARYSLLCVYDVELTIGSYRLAELIGDPSQRGRLQVAQWSGRVDEPHGPSPSETLPPEVLRALAELAADRRSQATGRQA